MNNQYAHRLLGPGRVLMIVGCTAKLGYERSPKQYKLIPGVPYMQKRRLTHTLLIWCVLVVFLLLTKPQNLPVVVLMVPFILLGLALYMTWLLVVSLFLPLKERQSARSILGGMVASTFVICLGLQSIGELTARDVVPVALFVALVYFYIVRSTKTT